MKQTTMLLLNSRTTAPERLRGPDEHTLLTHTSCEDPSCVYCIGGLAYCTVCRGGECELPTECPGQPMTSAQRQAVCAGVLDFKDGTWGRTSR